VADWITEGICLSCSQDDHSRDRLRVDLDESLNVGNPLEVLTLGTASERLIAARAWILLSLVSASFCLEKSPWRPKGAFFYLGKRTLK